MIRLLKRQAIKRTIAKESQILTDQRNAAINELKNLNKQLKKALICTSIIVQYKHRKELKQ